MPRIPTTSPRPPMALTPAAIRSRTPLAILAAAGLAMLAATTPSTHAQSTIEWAMPVDGDFGVAANWFPSVVPGATDTAVLGGVGPYVVTISADGAADSLDLTNPLTEAHLLNAVTFELATGLFGPGKFVVNPTTSRDDAMLNLGSGAIVETTVQLAGDAVVTSIGPEPVLIGPNGTIFGNGRLQGPFRLQGEIQISATLGALELWGGSVIGEGGRIRSFGGLLYTTLGARLDGVHLDSRSGISQISGGRTNPTRLQNPVIDGQWDLSRGTTMLELGGLISGTGTFIVGPEDGSYSQRLELADGAILNIPVRFRDTPRTQTVTAVAGARATIGPDSTISGNGLVDGPLEIQGVLESIGAGTSLALGGDITLAGGEVRVSDGGVLNSISATISGSRMVGGVSSSPAVFTGGTLDDITMDGVWALAYSGECFVSGEVTGTGTIVINDSSRGPRDTRMLLLDGARLDVPIVLNAPFSTAGDAFFRAELKREGGGVATIGTGSVVSGRGRMSSGEFDFRGTLAPGFGPTDHAQIQFGVPDVFFAEESAFEIDASGPTSDQHDLVDGSGDVDLGGRLRVRFTGGYEPSAGDRLRIMRVSTTTGAFDLIEIDQIGPFGPAHVVYERDPSGLDSVWVVMCAADRDGDGELTIFDFLEFQNQFDAGDPQADLDQDGRLTIFDFLAFQNRFDAGC